MALWASGDRVIPAKMNIGQPYGVNGFAVSDTIAFAAALNTYFNMAGTSSFSFTKLNAATRVRLEMALSIYTTGGVGNGLAGVRINSVDYDVCSMATSTASERMPVGGVVWIAGIPAGTYTIQARWKRTGGSGSPVYTRDVQDWLMIEATEVA